MQVIYPGSLNQALVSSSIRAGDRIQLKSGTYTGDFVASLQGTAAKPITIMPFPGANVVIEGSLAIGIGGTCSYVILDGDGGTVEIRRSAMSDWTRVSDQTDLPWMASGKALYSSSPNITLRNCIIHDSFDGIRCTNYADLTMIGNLVYYIGYQGPDRGHSHATYNYGQRTVMQKNIFVGGFSLNVHCYGEHATSANLDNFLLEDNISICVGQLSTDRTLGNILLGGGTLSMVAHSPVLRRNYTYKGAREMIGYTGGATDITLEDNYFPEGTSINGNILSDTGGTYTHESVNRNFVVPVTTTKAHAAIYNWEGLASVVLDLTATGWAAGTTVAVHNVQDYFNDLQSLTLDADKKILIDMQLLNRTVAAPAGGVPAPTSTFPTFGCFVVQKA